MTPWTVACQAPPSMGFSRQEYWSGLPFPSPGDLSNPGIKPRSPELQADSLPSELQERSSSFQLSSIAQSCPSNSNTNILKLLEIAKTVISCSDLPPPNQVTVSPEDMLIATSSMQWLRTQTLEPSGLGLNLSFSTNYSCELGQVTELFCASVFSYVK